MRVTSAGRHLGADDDGRRRQPAVLRQLVQLEVRQQGGDLVAGDDVPVARRGRGPSRRGGRRRGRWPGPGRRRVSRASAAARSIDSGTSGLGVLVTLGNWPSGVICSATGRTRKPCSTRTSIAVSEPTPCSGVKTTLKSSIFGGGDQALLAAEVDVAPVRWLVEEVDLAGAHGLGPGQVADRRDLIDEVGHDLVVGRHRLAAALVVELAAVVVGRVVRGRQVQPAVRLQAADGERQLRRGQVVLAVRRQDVGVDAVGGVDAGGVLGERPAGEVQDRVGQVGVVLLALVLELADVVGRGRRAAGSTPGNCSLRYSQWPWTEAAERPEVHAVGADADGPAPAAGAERQDLVEAVEQAGPLPRGDEPFDLRPVGGEVGLGEPLAGGSPRARWRYGSGASTVANPAATCSSRSMLHSLGDDVSRFAIPQLGRRLEGCTRGILHALRIVLRERLVRGRYPCRPSAAAYVRRPGPVLCGPVHVSQLPEPPSATPMQPVGSLKNGRESECCVANHWSDARLQQLHSPAENLSSHDPSAPLRMPIPLPFHSPWCEGGRRLQPARRRTPVPLT